MARSTRDDIKVTFLDVGVGDSISITFTEGDARRCILVDGGDTRRASQVVSRHLAEEGIEAIDLLVATHFDQDHIRGLIYLLRDMADRKGPLAGMPVEHYWGPMPLTSTLRRIRLLEGLGGTSRFVIQSLEQNEELLQEVRQCIREPSRIRFPSVADMPPLNLFKTFRIELLAPESQVPAEEVEKAALFLPTRRRLMRTRSFRTLADLKRAVHRMQERSARRADHTANNLSLVLRLTPTPSGLQEWRILLTGDAEESSWTSMVARGESLSARILKVSHHGSSNGTPDWIIPRIRPSYNVISVGQRHGHPSRDVYRSLLLPGGEIFCTEKNMGSRPSGCREFSCPKTENPGPLSILMQADPPRVSTEPDDAFCTETLHRELRP